MTTSNNKARLPSLPPLHDPVVLVIGNVDRSILMHEETYRMMKLVVASALAVTTRHRAAFSSAICPLLDAIVTAVRNVESAIFCYKDVLCILELVRPRACLCTTSTNGGRSIRILLHAGPSLIDEVDRPIGTYVQGSSAIQHKPALANYLTDAFVNPYNAAMLPVEDIEIASGIDRNVDYVRKVVDPIQGAPVADNDTATGCTEWPL
mmetsp:Transcript_79429/g.137754  ORF Transcript_79429/g.137754 Transcript_79429/m.137754 type:complete len:207 (+) Transcript_79429:240-860(+)